MAENINKKIGKATAWSSVTEIVAKLITPIVNMVLAHLLAPEAFGIVATIMMVITFAEVFTDAGFQKYIIQHEFSSREELDNSTNVAFWTNLSFSALVCVIIFIFRHSIAILVGSPGLGNSISIASAAIILVAFSSIQMARYKRDFDFKTLFYVRIITACIPLVVTIPLAIVLRSYWALLIGTLATHFFNALLLTIKSSWKPKFYYNFALLKEMFSFSMWTLLESISIWITTHVDIFIVGNYLNDHYLGLYKTSMTTVNSYMAIITSAITPVLFSALSRYQNDENKFRSTFFSFQRLTSVLVIPMGAGMFLFSDLVTDILLGSQWGEASFFMGLWALTSIFAIIFSNFSSEVYRSKGHPKTSLIVQVIHLAFLIPTLIIGIRYGFRVLCVSRALIRFQMMLTALIIMHFAYGFKIPSTLKNIFPALISACVMGIFGYFIKGLNGSMIWQFVSVFLCVIVYFAVLFILFPKTRKELLEADFTKKILRKIKL